MSQPGMLKQSIRVLKVVLDDNHPPVARFRLLSSGVSANQALYSQYDAKGAPGALDRDKACMSCGNCVDACPVILRKFGSLPIQSLRTSMYLETAVADSCIRCYSCIRACPQVDKGLKDFALRFRMAEKTAHWVLAGSYIILASTGIFMSHFRTDWSPLFNLIVSTVHKTAAVFFLLSPVLLFLFDRPHLMRLLKALGSWGKADWQWLKDFLASVPRPTVEPAFFQGEFNTGQKLWYLWVMAGLVAFPVSGAIKWFFKDSVSPEVLAGVTTFHATFALITDVALVVHFYRKILSRQIVRAKLILKALPGVLTGALAGRTDR